MTKRKSTPKAYSYVRFSRSDQMEGDSLRRQTEAAQKYADQEGLELDTELTFADLGVSAYRGANFEASLGKFIEAVDSGQVKKGSYLLVENLDRLSRDSIRTARDRFEALLDRGVNIVTLTDGKSYSAEGYDLQDMLITLLDMSRAHSESKLKADRQKAAWRKKRERAVKEGHVLTAKGPAWLEFRDGKFHVIRNRAKVVKRIYQLSLEGHGQEGIARRLNKEGVEPFGKSGNGWYASYIRSILTNQSVTGRFQPMRDKWVDGKRKHEKDGDVIERYYPAVVDDATYYQVQQARPGVSGRKNRALTNVLKGLVFCFKCRGPMHYVNKGSTTKGGQYLSCDNARRRFTCDAKSVRYGTALQAVLRKVDLPTPWLVGRKEQNERKREIFEQLTSNEASQAELDGKIERLLDSLERTQSAAMEKRLQQYEEEKEQLIASMERWSDQLDSVNGNGHHLEETREAVEEFNRVMTGDDEEKIGAIRVRLNACLKKLIERVEVGPAGVKVIPKGTLTAPELGREVGRDGSFTFKLD